MIGRGCSAPAHPPPHGQRPHAGEAEAVRGLFGLWVPGAGATLFLREELRCDIIQKVGETTHNK